MCLPPSQEEVFFLVLYFPMFNKDISAFIDLRINESKIMHK